MFDAQDRMRATYKSRKRAQNLSLYIAEKSDKNSLWHDTLTAQNDIQMTNVMNEAQRELNLSII